VLIFSTTTPCKLQGEEENQEEKEKKMKIEK
jgi:hypothetical protein